MLQLRKITLTHKKDNRVLLENLDLVVNPGDKAAIIGEEGNGKSTLLKLIYDEQLVEEYAEYSGEIIRNQKRLGYLAQELSESMQELSVYDFMCSQPGFWEIAPSDLAGIGKALQLQPAFFYSEQQVRDLSGGEKVKLQLAGILVQEPDILLLDEPSNDLDVRTVEWLERFIAESKLPILYISHDEVLLENTANMIIHVEQLRRKTRPRVTVVRSGYREYVEERLRSMTHQEQVARKERSDYQKQQEKFRQIQQKVEHQQNVISRQDPHGAALLKKTMHRIKAYEARFEKEYENMTELPESEDAIFVKFGERCEMPAGKVVLDLELPILKVGDHVLARNLSLYVRGPEKICIVGRNGVGKTTLLRQIAEQMLTRTDVKVSYMPQNYEELLDMEQTPVAFLSQTGDREESSRIRTYLGSMKYTADEMEHRIADLSGGQKAKLLLLQMSMSGSNVLILDEPTRNFSPLSGPVIRRILREYRGAILSVSHDRKYIQEVAEKVCELTPDGLNCM